MSERAPWGTQDGVTVTAGKTWQTTALCDGCAWEDFTEAKPRTVTDRAKRHTAESGHTVTLQRTRVVRVEPDPDRKRRAR